MAMLFSLEWLFNLLFELQAQIENIKNIKQSVAFRLPLTEVDDSNIADFIFISSIAFCRSGTEAK